MLQYSKLLKSRKEWKEKAIKRRKQIRELKKAQKCHQIRIKELKQRCRELSAEKKVKKATI